MMAFFMRVCPILLTFLTHGSVLTIAADRTLIAAGWGREWAYNGTDDNGNPSNKSSPKSAVLREVQIPFVNQAECKKAWNGDYFVYDFQICAGEPGKGICYGDSGKTV